jgi:predicted acylesterase/phospholipase RssA
MALEIQIAFQGGGAKLCDLLAAAEAIQELENEGEIRVTRVAGTSAGSIAACLLGHKDSIRLSIGKLQSKGASILQGMGSADLGLLALIRIARGYPIVREKPFRKLLQILFKGYDRIKDLGLPVFILASDILSSGKHVFAPDAMLVSSIADSCGLPFVFRSSGYMAASRYVDGGICENLPSDELLPEVAQFGPVVAVSFLATAEAEHPDNTVDFMKLLVNTSINNSILRAQRILGDSAVHRIETDIDTFDFQRALASLEGDHYTRVKLECRNWFRGFVLTSQGGRQQLMVGGPGPRPQAIVTDIMDKIARLYESQAQNVKMKIVRSAFIVTAFSLIKKGEAQYGSPDVLRLEYEVEPLEASLSSFALTIGSDQQVAGPASWTVTGPDLNACPFVAIPMDSKAAYPSGALAPFSFKHENEIALFFTPPLLPEVGSYRIIQQEIRLGAMNPLKEVGKDFLTLLNQKPVPYSSAMLILYVPECFPLVNAVQYTEDKTLNVVEGRPMSAAELNAFGPPPPGFRAIGWVAVEAVKPEHSLATSFLAH